MQNYYKKGKDNIALNNFNARIEFFKEKSKKKMENTEIIDCYMRFIYSTIEYSIMPIVNIALDLKVQYNNWLFGENVIKSIEDCKKKYYNRTYGNVNYDDLTESQKNIIGALKDYGMTNAIKNINNEILEEIEGCLNVRYSTIDVLNAISKLTHTSKHNKSFFKDLKKYYM